MDVQITQKKLNNKNRWAYSLRILNVKNLEILSQTKTYFICRGQDWVKMFCTFLRGHAKNITDFEKKKLLPFTKEELKSYQDANVCYICGKKS